MDSHQYGLLSFTKMTEIYVRAESVSVRKDAGKTSQSQEEDRKLILTPHFAKKEKCVYKILI